MADLTVSSEMGACDLSIENITDLSAKLYCAVKINTSSQCVVSGAGEKSAGILQNAPNGSSRTAIALVRVSGTSMVLLGGTVAFGDFLKPDSSGFLVKAASAGNDYIVKALSAGQSGDQILAVICHGEVEGSDAS